MEFDSPSGHKNKVSKKSMADIIKQTRKILKKQGHSQKEIDFVTNMMLTTCLACKYSADCRAKGIVKSPYNPKCKSHELTNDFTNYINKKFSL